MKTIEQYAIDLVCDGAESFAEDDIDEEGELSSNAEHEAACWLALEVVRRLRANPAAILDLCDRPEVAR